MLHLSIILNTEILLLHMFIRGLLLNHISEIHCILEFSTSNTNLLLNYNEFSSILVQKVYFWYNNNNYSEIYIRELQ